MVEQCINNGHLMPYSTLARVIGYGLMTLGWLILFGVIWVLLDP
jgi:hypothetical protein